MQQDHIMQQQTQPDVKPGGHTSLAAHHAASKLAAMAAAGDIKQAPASAKTSPATSRSGSISQQGPFESQTQIQQQQQQQPPPTPAATQAPGRPVSSRGHMLPQSAQMISEAERRREQEMEHIFAPQPGQIIAERCQSHHSQRAVQFVSLCIVAHPSSSCFVFSLRLADEFLKLMGRGTFSQVLLCRDLAATAGTDAEMAGDDDGASTSQGGNLISIPLKPKNVVAIKVIRDVARYRHAAEKEARILQHLAATKHSPCHPAQPLKELQTARGMQQDSMSGAYGVNPLLGWFRMGGHFCLVFPPLGCSLYDFLRANHFRPMFRQYSARGRPAAASVNAKLCCCLQPMPH